MSLLAPTFVAETRHVVGAGAITLEVIWPDPDGDAADLTGETITVSATDADGTVIQTGTASLDATNTSRATFTLDATHTTRPRWLSLTWTRTSDGAIQSTSHELAGGVFFTVAQARTEIGGMSDAAKYPSLAIRAARLAAERECEEICNVAFVPRFARVRLHSTGHDRLAVPHRRVREVIAVTEDGTPWTADELADVRSEDGYLGLDVGWPCDELVLEYFHGWDRPPVDMLRSHMRRARWAIDKSKSLLPAGAFAGTTPEGQQITLQRADRMRTGDHEVDAVYARHTDRESGIA